MQENMENAGGTRFNRGKPGGWWYAPIYGLRLVAGVWQQGAEKYAPLDWAQGQSFSTLFDCAMRHMIEAVMHGPWARCPESGHLHLAHAAWNILCLLTFMALNRTDLDDITPYQGVTSPQLERAQRVANAEGRKILDVLRAKDYASLDAIEARNAEPGDPEWEVLMDAVEREGLHLPPQPSAPAQESSAPERRPEDA